jgi:hypothetical protein
MLRAALLLLLLPLPAAAAERSQDAEAVAAEAEQAVQSYCSDAAGDDTTLAAQSVARVSEVWARVSETLEQSRKVYLLYWRGVLAQCLDQEVRALDDLRGFLAARSDSTVWASLIADAERRVGRIERRIGGVRGPSPSTGPVVGSLALGGAAGAFAALSGWQWSEAEAQAQRLYAGDHIGPNAAAFYVEGDQLADRSRAFLVASVGTGAASVVIAVASAAQARSAVAAAPWLVPTDGGLALGIGGRF